jgi:hypothetical protein
MHLGTDDRIVSAGSVSKSAFRTSSAVFGDRLLGHRLFSGAGVARSSPCTDACYGSAKVGVSPARPVRLFTTPKGTSPITTSHKR